MKNAFLILKWCLLILALTYIVCVITLACKINSGGQIDFYKCENNIKEKVEIKVDLMGRIYVITEGSNNSIDVQCTRKFFLYNPKNWTFKNCN